MHVPRPLFIAVALFAALLLHPEAQQAAHAVTPGCTITVDTVTDSQVPDNDVSLREATMFATGVLAPAAGEMDEISGCPVPGAGFADHIVFDPSVFPAASPVTINLGGPLSLNTGGDTIDGGSRSVILDGGGINDCVWVYDSSDNEVKGLSIQNCNFGVYVYSNSAVTADNAMRDNQFGGNSTGVAIAGGPERTVVEGNVIGLALGSSSAMQPNGTGIGIENATDSTIGGMTAGARNVISGNTYNGIFIDDLGSTGNRILGNYIGTTKNGQTARGNGNFGLEINGSPDNEVAGNVISGNTYAAVALMSDTTAGTVIRDNFIGTNAEGTFAVSNGQGVFIGEGPGNTVEDNVISGNDGPGVSVIGATAAGNVFQRNLVGVAADGHTALGNGDSGMSFFGTGPNIIGGDSMDDGNIIAFNTHAGVEIVPNAPVSIRKLIRANSIHSNGGLGIDLAADGITGDGVTPNDAGDGDFGGNQLQNYPEIQTATIVGTDLHVEGTLSSAPSTEFRIDFYASEACDPSGYGEGERYLAFASITTNGSGTAAIAADRSANAAPGEFLTATATDPENNTSEFSQCVQITQGATPTPTPTHSPSPTPTTSPTPTATPGPQGLLGDTDCNQNVNAVDALWVLKEIAGIGTPPACIAQGDVQCDSDRDSVDSLGILRYVAQLPPISQQPGCRAIGT